MTELPDDLEDLGLPPEATARLRIDAQLKAAGWVIQNRKTVNLAAARGVAVREFLLNGGDEIDYLLYVDGHAVGGLEAKPEGVTLTGVEPQSARYSTGVPDHVPTHIRPLPFLYESTGVETQFTNGLDPEPRSRLVFNIHQPETLARWIEDWRKNEHAPTFRARLRQMPVIDDTELWPAQTKAIAKLEESLAEDRPRALIQMATGSGKTYTAANEAWRLTKFAGAKKILFLVDRANLGIQTEGEFERFHVPGDGRKFTELYPIQRLTRNSIRDESKVVICTIQRLYSILRNDETFDDELDEQSADEALPDEQVDVVYNRVVPPDLFDVIIVDECHRSIYGRWSQVLDYFDAHIVGLTATPSKQTIGYFKRNLVFSYSHEEAVADKVNVDFDVYRIRTKISTDGSTIDKGTWATFRERVSRRKRWEELEDDLTYTGDALDKVVVAEDQIRTIIRHYRDVIPTLFPGRVVAPKTLIFAKDDSHADDIVRIIREEFARGNDFAVKITYKNKDSATLLAAFRTTTLPRIAVTVDMIATGTDVKPLECLIFMRSVQSRNFFEQMKGRGVRVVDDDTLQEVSPGATTKDRFVLIDAVGVTEGDMGESQPLERKKTVSLDKLLEQVAVGSRDPEVISSIASRLTRLDRQLSKPDRAELTDIAGGVDLGDIAHDLILASDPDRAYEAAEAAAGGTPTDDQVAAARKQLIDAAVAPLATNPALRTRIVEVRRSYDQIIDSVSLDEVVEAGFSVDATARAKQTIGDWKKFIEDNHDELAALEILYDRPAGKRLTFAEIRELANAIGRPPHRWTPEVIWKAYEVLDKSKVRGSGGHILTDLVSLVRFTLEQENELVPWTETVNERFLGWLSAQEQGGHTFTDVQLTWLELIRDQIAGSLTISRDDLMQPPFSQHGGLGRARKEFGDDLDTVLGDLTAALVA